MSETFQYSSISNGENRINIAGYSLTRTDHPSSTNNEDVCIYYKDFLPLIEKDDIRDVKEWLVTEKTVYNEKCFFTKIATNLGISVTILVNFLTI